MIELTALKFNLYTLACSFNRIIIIILTYDEKYLASASNSIIYTYILHTRYLRIYADC